MLPDGVVAPAGSGYDTRPFQLHPPGRAGRPRRNPMSSYNTSEFRSGLKILLDKDPYTIVENEFVKPGKGQAFNRVRIKNLRTGRVIERTFKSGDSVEAADVVDVDMQYLYGDGQFWHFMQPESFEQFAAGETAVGDAAQWLKEGTVCIITLWNGQPLTVTPPPHVELKIVETDPGHARRHRHRRHQGGEARDRRRGQGAALPQPGRSRQGRYAQRRLHRAGEVSR